jgi:uracil phosphoribosyltransferase
MLRDTQYFNNSFKLPEIEHKYGPNVHIVNDPYLFTTLARLCQPQCEQPLVNALLDTLYRELVKAVVNAEFPLLEENLQTRMHQYHPEGEFQAPLIDPNVRVVCVSLARAGIVPSQICYDAFNYMLKPSGVRQDHISINRKVDEHDHVVGTNLGGLKIGGDIADRVVVIPDPMGATGSTLKTAMEVYQGRGKAKKFIAIHLIVTPEYLALHKRHFPEVSVYAIRLDRGLSPKHVLQTVPGTHWSEERGLNDRQYIVPGAGGLGEVINNAYV